jgi:hypothetical protein
MTKICPSLLGICGAADKKELWKLKNINARMMILILSSMIFLLIIKHRFSFM